MTSGRAVITGVGVVSPFGVGLTRMWDGLAEGRSAVGPIRSFDASTFPTRVAGCVPTAASLNSWAPSLSEHVPAWQDAGSLRDRKVAFLLVAAQEAWRQAQCGAAERHAAVSLALGLEQAMLEDFGPLVVDGAIDWTREPSAKLPETRFRSRVSLGSALLRQMLALRGATTIHVSACAASAMAIGHALALIARGTTDIVLCGGADSMVNPLGIGGMSRLGAPSPRHTADACRPFDARRDGLVVGEGAAVFVVELEERARARGIEPLAHLLGYGSSQDGYKATAPRPDGTAAARAMSRSLERARLAPEELGYINAHGTGTPLNDPAEVRAIRLALGQAAETIPVSSIKGAVGHLMAASGAIELAASLMVFTRDLLPGTAHYQVPDPECDLDIIGPAPRARRIDSVLSNSFGFGGQNACVVLGRPRWR